MGVVAFRFLALPLCLISASVVPEAVAQNEAGVGYVEDIEREGAPATGLDVEVDAAGAQAVSLESGAEPALSRRTKRQVEEIVVSARRREEMLEDTPISITAINAEGLVEAQVTRFDELQFLVPNLRIDGFSGGRGGPGTEATIRGVGPTESGNTGVGLYLDGIFLLNGGGDLLNVLDIEQVEVLRGPQGTLFGKNTLGGAINYTTVAPADEFSGSAWLRVGRYNTVESRAMLNVPVKLGALEDKVFTRWSFASRNSDGYIYNSALDQYHAGIDALWFVGKTRILPTEDLTIDINANYTKQQSNGQGGRCFVVDEADASLRGLLLAANPNFYEKCAQTSNYEFHTFQQMLYQTQNYGIWGNINYDFGEIGFMDELSFKLLGSWRQRDFRNREDVDLTEDEIVQLSNINIGNVQGATDDRTGSLVEAQVFGTTLDGDVTAVAGFFASWLNQTRANITRTNSPTLDTVGGFTVGPVEQNDKDWAFYGQATWNVIEWISLTGGIRYTSETRAVARSTIFPVGNGTTDDPVVTSAGSDSKTFTQWTPMASLQLFVPEDLLEDAPIDHLMGYFTYAKGFSSGGFNAVVGTGLAGGLIPFDPATLDNFEIGVKTITLDQRATFNVSFFYMNYDDIQVVQSRTIEIPGQDLPETARLIVNASSAVLKGIEGDVLLRPIDGLLITGNVGILDSTYGDFPDVWSLDSRTPFNREGQTFNNTPYWTTFLAAQYSFDVDAGVPWLSGWLTPRVDWYYQDQVHTAQPEDPSGWQRGFNRVNARLSYDFLDDRAQVALWGKNLANAEYFYGGGGTTGFFGYAGRYYQEPITFGGEISYRFGAG